jgi:hypothetical protein
MLKLTARTVETLKPQQGKRREIADHVVRGLSLRVSAAGGKSWALRYRNSDGIQRRLTLGGFPALSLNKARAAARQARGRVADAADPAREKQDQRRAGRRARREKPQTLLDLWVAFSREELPKRRPSTAAYHAWLWRKHVGPRLGDQRLADLSAAIVRPALRDVGAGAPVTANRAMTLLRRMLNFAVEEEIISVSPLAGARRLYDEASRERVLTDSVRCQQP